MWLGIGVYNNILRQTVGQAEFRVLGAGLNQLMRMGFDARRNAEHDIDVLIQFVGHLKQFFQLIFAVDDDEADAVFQRVFQFADFFVIAVVADAVHWKISCLSSHDFPF